MMKKKEKITIDKLAEKVDNLAGTVDNLADMTQSEFLAMRNEFATKDDLKQYATKDDLQRSTVMVLQAIDGVVARFDKMEQDSAADKLLHDRHETALENHDVRIKALETA